MIGTSPTDPDAHGFPPPRYGQEVTIGVRVDLEFFEQRYFRWDRDLDVEIEAFAVMARRHQDVVALWKAQRARWWRRARPRAARAPTLPVLTDDPRSRWSVSLRAFAD